MMFENDRQSMRNAFFDAWEKHKNEESLEPLQTQIATVIADHPEYHFIFNDKESYLDKDYTPEDGEANPYLHLSLHLGLREQVSTNRPIGITKVFRTLTKKLGDPLEAEHKFMDVLGEYMWRQQRGESLSEQDYMDALRRL